MSPAPNFVAPKPKPQTRPELEASTGFAYDTIRSTLKTGDLFFASGDYQFSRQIRSTTHSIWSHVALIVCVHDRVLVLESIELVGVRLAPLSKYLQDYDKGKPCDGVLGIARRHDMTENHAKTAVSWGLDRLTRPYNHAEIMDIVLRATFKLKATAKVDERDGFVCSELVYCALKAAGLPVHGDEYGFISPQNIWEHDQVDWLGRVLP